MLSDTGWAIGGFEVVSKAISVTWWGGEVTLAGGENVACRVRSGGTMAQKRYRERR